MQEWGKIRVASPGYRLGGRLDSPDQRFVLRSLDSCFATPALAHSARLPWSDWAQTSAYC